ncbi:MAG: sortase [Patescibacteria group bacterium]
MNSILDENELKSFFESEPSVTRPSVSTPPTIPTAPATPSISATQPIRPEIFNGSPVHPAEELEPGKTLHAGFKSWLVNFAKIFWKFSLIFILIFILAYTVINFSAISKQSNYFYNYSFGKKTPSQAAPTPPQFNPTDQATLSVPKISVSAPIIWNVDINNYTDQLLLGVVQFKGTALPGQNGNIFITGHSSYYSWVKSPYKAVFALLDKLNVGDKIYIQYQNSTYTYQVNDSKVVSPNAMQVLGSGSKPTLTLMTCVPVGTNLNRLIVTADQIGVSGQF